MMYMSGTVTPNSDTVLITVSRAQTVGYEKIEPARLCSIKASGQRICMAGSMRGAIGRNRSADHTSLTPWITP